MPNIADKHGAFVEVTRKSPSECLPAIANVVGAPGGYAIIEKVRRPEQGVKLLIWFCGRHQYAYLAGEALITDDGEAIEGDSLDDVRLIGIVTHTIHPPSSDTNPFM